MDKVSARTFIGAACAVVASPLLLLLAPPILLLGLFLSPALLTVLALWKLYGMLQGNQEAPAGHTASDKNKASEDTGSRTTSLEKLPEQYDGTARAHLQQSTSREQDELIQSANLQASKDADIEYHLPVVENGQSSGTAAVGGQLAEGTGDKIEASTVSCQGAAEDAFVPADTEGVVPTQESGSDSLAQMEEQTEPSKPNPVEDADAPLLVADEPLESSQPGYQLLAVEEGSAAPGDEAAVPEEASLPAGVGELPTGISQAAASESPVAGSVHENVAKGTLPAATESSISTQEQPQQTESGANPTASRDDVSLTIGTLGEHLTGGDEPGTGKAPSIVSHPKPALEAPKQTASEGSKGAESKGKSKKKGRKK